MSEATEPNAKANAKARQAALKAVKEAVRNGVEVEKEEGFWSGDGVLTARMEGAFKTRGNMELESPESKARVLKKIEEAMPGIAALFGTVLDRIPQGQIVQDQIRNGLLMAVAQIQGNMGPLNNGYGPESESAAKKPDKSGKPGSDGLLAPGSTPDSAIDVDQAKNETTRQACLKRGAEYEGKLRMFDNLCRDLHVTDPRHRFCVLARRVLWSFKLHGKASGNVWDIFQHGIKPVLTFATIETFLFAGNIVQSLLPSNLDLPSESTTGMQSDNGTTGWLSSNIIEAAFWHCYPAEPCDGAVYLGISDTLLLDPSVAHTRSDNAKNPLNMSMKALVQYKRDHKGVIPEEVLRRHFKTALHLSHETKRVFFFCNPSGNHWIVICAHAVDGSKIGLITVYDSLGRDLGAHYLVLSQYFTIMSSIPGSPFAGYNWKKADIEQGQCGLQSNDIDCGLFALENLVRLASGTEQEENLQSDSPPLDRRYAWFETLAQLVEESTGFPVGEIDNVKKATAPKASALVSEMLKPWTIQHWQFMLCRARPDLINNFPGQYHQLERIYPSILAGISELSGFGQVVMPDHNHQSVPAVALGLNDHDIALAQPQQSRVPDAVFVVMRSSRPQSGKAAANTDQQSQLLGEAWCETFYPGIELDPTVIKMVYSSTLPFLLMAESIDTFVSAHTHVQENRLARQPFIDAMDQLEVESKSDGERKLVVVIQANFDGCTSVAESFSTPSKWWPTFDFHLATYSRFDKRERQPFDSAAIPSEKGTWIHYIMKELAARATAKQYTGLGPYLDIHNQGAYLLQQINSLKAESSGVATAYNFPIASFLTGSGTRLYQTVQTKVDTLMAKKALSTADKHPDIDDYEPESEPESEPETTGKHPQSDVDVATTSKKQKLAEPKATKAKAATKPKAATKAKATAKPKAATKSKATAKPKATQPTAAKPAQTQFTFKHWVPPK